MLNMTNRTLEKRHNDRYEDEEDSGRRNRNDDVINNVIFAELTGPINSEPLWKEGGVLHSTFEGKVLINEDVLKYSEFEADYFQLFSPNFQFIDNPFEITITNPATPPIEDTYTTPTASQRAVALEYSQSRSQPQSFPNPMTSEMFSPTLPQLHNASILESHHLGIIDPSLYRTPKTRRAAPKNVTPKKQPYPYPTPSPSQSSSDDDPIPRITRGKQRGFNLKTGELTLIGRFPPLTLDNGKTYYCPVECVDPIMKRRLNWTTRNGYKYHLQHACPQNPESTRPMKVVAGEMIKPVKKAFGCTCDMCGKFLRSASGWKKHRFENESTKEGKCLLKREKAESPKTDQGLNLLADGQMGRLAESQGDSIRVSLPMEANQPVMREGQPCRRVQDWRNRRKLLSVYRKYQEGRNRSVEIREHEGKRSTVQGVLTSNVTAMASELQRVEYPTTSASDFESQDRKDGIS
jgi:hypothetical protein